MGFNSCFNGYSTLTLEDVSSKLDDVSFNPCFNGYSTLTVVE